MGQILKRSLGYETMSFASAVKDSLAHMMDWDRIKLEGLEPSSRTWRETPDPFWTTHFGQPVTPRQMMQTFGTELVRNHLHRDFWVFRLRKSIEQTDGPVVVTDVRFPNEHKLIRDLGGEIYWVRRDQLPQHYESAIKYNSLSPLLKKLLKPFYHKLLSVHESERAWVGLPVNKTIHNSHNLYALEQAVHKAVLP